MIGLKTLHEHDGDMYTNALIATFTRLNIIKVNNLYSYGWAYDPCKEVAQTNYKNMIVLDNLNI